MTPQQKLLARHALGLPNERMRSYRNRYYASEGTPAQAAWRAMVAAGFASSNLTERQFGLTEAGARLALHDGESLCPEDFPA